MKLRKLEVTKDHAKIFGPAVFIIVLGFVLAYQFVNPAPPKQIVFATGDPHGAYHHFAERYREILAREGIELELRESAGSLQNIELLRSGQVDIAFVQGGTRPESVSRDELLSLGSMFFEPLWVFLPGDAPIGRLTQLRGKRLAVGNDGSGTQAITRQLLSENRITPTETEWLTLSNDDMAGAIVEARIDAGIVVASPESKTVTRLLNAPHLRVMSFDRALAYTRRHSYLSSVLLPQGVIDLDRNVPDGDVKLLSPTANLVAVADIHPALVSLLLQAAVETHGEGSLFADHGQFPSPRFLEFRLSEEAKRFYKSGSPFLQRYLPFWAATFIDRMLVMLLPFIALMVPLFRIMPPVFRWRVRARIYRWYRELLEIDPLVHRKDDVHISLKALDRIESEVSKVEVPMSYADQLYHLRLHLELVRNKLMARR